MQASNKIKVLYIAGFERSGSTIVNRVLGQIDGFVAWGELRDIWEHAILENRACSCGVPFHQCETWQKILDRAYGGIENIDAQKLFQLQRQTRAKLLLKKFGKLGEQQLRSHSADYFDALEKLYSAIQSETQCRVIVDSTKASWYGATLDMLPNIDLYVLHITRDPRGVCHSLKRRKAEGEPECQWYNPVRASFSWSWKNSAVESLLNRQCDRYLRVQFETFVDQPQTTMQQILQFIGEENAVVPFADQNSVEMGIDHIFTGSPSSRSETGKVKLKLDDRWKRDLPESDIALVTTLTKPVLRKYGYA